MKEHDDLFIGETAAYNRMWLVAHADDPGAVRRIARDLTPACREGCIGIAAADLFRDPDDLSAELVWYVLKDLQPPPIAKAEGR